MRAIEGEIRPTRALTSIWLDAYVVFRQDAGEYGFIALIGGVAAAIVAAGLRLAGGEFVDAAIVPLVLLCAIFTYATACAALARLDSQLEPDAALAFVAALARAPWLLIPMVPSLLLTYGAVLAGTLSARWIPSTAATAIGLALLAYVSGIVFRRSLYVPSLFVRGATAKDAWIGGGAMLRTMAGAVGVTWLAILLPALLLGLVSLAAGFGVVSVTLASFAFVGVMPYAAAAMTLLCQYAAYAAVYEEEAPPVRRGQSARRATTPASTADRLRRRRVG